MAGPSSEAQHPLTCSICLDLLQDPVTTSCGHSFCMNCIKRAWDRENQSGFYRCPNCRKTFNERPTLSRSTVLAELLERMKDAPEAGPGDVMFAGYRNEKPSSLVWCVWLLIVKFTSGLITSLQEAFKKHKLMEPGLQQQICSQHHKALEIYCQDDRECICVLCTGDKHRGHKTISAAAEMTEKQKNLQIRQKSVRCKVTDRRKKVEEFKKAVDQHTRFAMEAVKETDHIFTEMIAKIQEKQAVTRAMVTTHVKQEVRQAQNHIQTLKTEIGHLQEEDEKLESLLKTEDYNYFFQNYSSSSGWSLHTSPSKDVSNIVTFENVITSVSELKKQMQKVCAEHKDRISKTVSDVQICKATSLFRYAETSCYADSDESDESY